MKPERCNQGLVPNVDHQTPQPLKQLPTNIATLDLSKVKMKLQSRDPATWTDDALALADREYRRFLTLKFLHPGREFVPTEFVDEVWHQHILDTAAYHVDCHAIFGRFLHHYPYYGMSGPTDAANLATSFHETETIYRATFGEDAPLATWARCKDHACHAPSSCACRTPGACKGE